MPSTYLNLCNQVLRRLNEVELTENDFANARGVQALVKDSVKNAVAKINQSEFEWPFNSASYTQTLTQGQSEYTWPTFLKSADWNSFQISKNDALGVGYKHLTPINRDDWYRLHRDDDYNAGNLGRGVPENVFASHGQGYGVTPSPDAAYQIRFNYFLNYTDLTNASDTTRIPETFDAVLVEGALYFLYMFKDTLEASQIAIQVFNQGIKDLQTLYINKYEYVTDTRISF